MRFSCFRVLPGSAEALVRWDGKIKYHLTPYFLGNIPAKNYQNRLMHVEVIASQSSVVFFWDTLYMITSSTAALITYSVHSAFR